MQTVHQWALAAGEALSRNGNVLLCSALLGQCGTDTALLPLCSGAHSLPHFCLMLCTIAFSDLIPVQPVSHESFRAVPVVQLLTSLLPHGSESRQPSCQGAQPSPHVWCSQDMAKSHQISWLHLFLLVFLISSFRQ